MTACCMSMISIFSECREFTSGKRKKPAALSRWRARNTIAVPLSDTGSSTIPAAVSFHGSGPSTTAASDYGQSHFNGAFPLDGSGPSTSIFSLHGPVVIDDDVDIPTTGDACPPEGTVQVVAIRDGAIALEAQTPQLTEHALPCSSSTAPNFEDCLLRLVKKGEPGPAAPKRKVATGSEVLTSETALHRLKEQDAKRKPPPKGRVPNKTNRGVQILPVQHRQQQASTSGTSVKRMRTMKPKDEVARIPRAPPTPEEEEALNKILDSPDDTNFSGSGVDSEESLDNFLNSLESAGIKVSS